MKKFLTICTVLVSFALFYGCGGETPKPKPKENVAKPAPTAPTTPASEKKGDAK